MYGENIVIDLNNPSFLREDNNDNDGKNSLILIQCFSFPYKININIHHVLQLIIKFHKNC